MKTIETDLPGCLVFEPRVFGDDRGYFYESFNHDKLAAHGLQPSFVQGKYVSVIEGEVWDVAVDIRRGSPTFGRWTAVVLSADNKRHFWIPEGFAHGFVTLSERAVFTYLCTATYDPAADASIRWDDPTLAIDWPVSSPSLSGKDAAAPLLADIGEDRLPVYMPIHLP